MTRFIGVILFVVEKHPNGKYHCMRHQRIQRKPYPRLSFRHADRTVGWVSLGLASLTCNPGATAQVCMNPFTEATVVNATRIYNLQKKDGLDAVLVSDASTSYVLDPSTLAVIDASDYPSTVLQSVLARDPFDDWYLVSVFYDGRVGSQDLTQSGTGTNQTITLHTLSWRTDLQRSSCTDDKLSMPLLIRDEQKSDRYRTLRGNTDTAFVGTRYDNGCGSGGADGNRVYAIDGQDGSIVDVFGDFGDGAAMDDVYGLAFDPLEDLLMVTTERTVSGIQPSVWAIDPVYFTKVWQTNAGRLTAPPVLRNGRLYVANTGGELIALDTATGAILWTLAPNPFFFPFTSDTEIIAPRAPPYHDAVILADSLGVIFFVRDLGTNARVEWSTDWFSSTGLLEFDPVAGAVYAGQTNGSIVRFNADTGAVEQELAVATAGSLPTRLALDWPVTDGDPVDLLSTWSLGTVARLCLRDEGILRNSLGPQERGEYILGNRTYEDADSNEVQVVIHQLELAQPTLLTHFEAVAAGPGPCDLGRGPTPCLENMQFFLMGWPAGTNVQGSPADPAAPGKLFHVNITSRLTLSRSYGLSRYQGTNEFPCRIEGTSCVPWELAETSLLSFDLRGLNLTCPAPGVQLALMGSGSLSEDGALEIPLLEFGVQNDSVYIFPAGTQTVSGQHAVRIRGVNCAMPNAFAEAYFGQDPRFGGGTLKPVGVAEGELVVQWQMTTNNPGIIAIPEWSPDAATWYASSNGPPGLERSIAVETVEGTNKVEVLEARMSTEGLSNALFRLRLDCP